MRHPSIIRYADGCRITTSWVAGGEFITDERAIQWIFLDFNMVIFSEVFPMFVGEEAIKK